MNGLELSRAYFEEYGLPMLRESFPDLLPLLAAGLTGSGSECFGFDDEVSRDHDFEPGFCLFLPGEDRVSRSQAFQLERAIARLPRTFRGVTRSLVHPVGGPRRGVFRTAEFYEARAGTRDGTLTLRQWLLTPDPVLAEATNGVLFMDGPGEVTRIRAALAHYPGDVRRKKLAAQLLLMGQSGQYNYARCLSHGETGAAQLAACEFVRHAMHAVFLLNGVYMPYYKWSFRAMRALPTLPLLAELMEYLLTTDNAPDLAREKQEVMEGICADVAREVRSQGLAGKPGAEMEPLAYAVQDGIADPLLRQMNILVSE